MFLIWCFFKSFRSIAHFAAYNDSVKTFLILEDLGIPTVTSRIDVYPIHIAAKYGNLKVCKWLWSHGSPYENLTKNGFSPLHLAVHFYRYDVADFLISIGCNINQQMGVYFTFLMALFYKISSFIWGGYSKLEC